MAKDTERLVAELLDPEKIRELTARYCQLLMSGRAKEVPDLFADDATFTSNAGLDVRGKPQIRAMYEVAEKNRLAPFIHNHLIEVSGKTARGTCAIEVQTTAPDGVRQTMAGFYRDRYVKVRGEWKFQSRDLQVVGDQPKAFDPARAEVADALRSVSGRGRRHSP